MLQSVLDPVLIPAHAALAAVADAVQPQLGTFAVPTALVLLTLVVRAVMIPLALTGARAQRSARALAPQIQRLRRRHAGNPRRLAEETRAVYREAGVSPYAGLLPGLLQAPLLFVVYRLCVVPLVGGAPNVVVAASVAGAPLAERAFSVVTAAGATQPAGLLVLAVVALLVAVAAASSFQAVRLLRLASPDGVTTAQLLVARVAPFASLAAVAVVPLAVTVYLVASATWTLAEREVLARVVG